MTISEHLSRLHRSSAYKQGESDKAMQKTLAAETSGFKDYDVVVAGQGLFHSDSEDRRNDKMAKLGYPYPVRGNLEALSALNESRRDCSDWTHNGDLFFFSNESDALYFSLLVNH